MGTLYDQSGNPVPIPDAQLSQALLSGQYLTDKPQVAVRAGGKVYNVPTEKLQEFNQTVGGVHVLSDTELAAHEAEKQQAALQQQYGGFGSELATVGINYADALLLGAGKGIAGAVGGEETKRYIRNLDAANPISAGVGTAFGLITPALLTGGTSLAEEAPEAAGFLARAGSAISAPTRALGEFGGLGNRAVRAVLGEGVAGRLAGGAAQGTMEGAVYGAGSAASEDIIHDKELTAEHLLAGAGTGALFGGGLGLAAAGLGLGAEKALSHVSESLGEGGSLRDQIQKKADEMYFSATGAKTQEYRKIAAKGFEPEDVGKWMQNDMPTFAKDGNAPLSREGILDATQNAMKDAGPKIDAHVDTLDEMGAKPVGDPVFERVHREVLDDLAKNIDPRVQSVGKLVGDIVNNAKAKFDQNPTFRGLLDLRRKIDANIQWNKVDPAQITTNGVLRNARNILEDEIGKQGTIAAGPQWGLGYNGAKNQYRMAKTVADATESSIDRIAGHRTGLSLTGTILAGHAFSAVHPLAAAGAIAATAANHLIREYGDAVGARILNKLSHIDAIRGLSLDFGTKTSDAVHKFLNATHAGASEAMVEIGRSFDKKRDQIDKLSADPQLLAQSMEHHLPTQAPQVSALMMQKAAGDVQYLKATMPQGILTGSTLTPQFKMPPSPVAKAEWMQRVDAIENPMSVLQDMQHGTLSPAKAEALKERRPKIMDNIMKTMMEGVADRAANGKEPSYKARIQMGILFGAVTDATLDPEFVKSQQALYAQGGTKGSEQPTSPLTQRAPATAAKMQLSLGKQIGTEAQRIEENQGVEV